MQNKEHNKKYYEDHKEQLRQYHKEYNKKYYEDHKEQLRQYAKEYTTKNKDKILEIVRRYRDKNRTKINEYHRKYYNTHKEQRKETLKKVYEKRKEQREIERFNTPLNIKRKNLLFGQDSWLLREQREKDIAIVNEKLKRENKSAEDMTFDEYFKFLMKKRTK